MIELQVEGVYRKCCLCEQWKKLSQFRGHGHACRRCCEVPLGAVGHNALSRSLTLTDKGRRAVRAA